MALAGGGLAYYFLVVAPKAAIDARMEEAQGYLEDERYRKAIPAFLEVIESDPTLVDAYIGLANAYVEEGDYEAAIELLEDAVKELDARKLERLLEDIEEEYEESLTASAPVEVIVEPEPEPEEPLFNWSLLGKI